MQNHDIVFISPHLDDVVYSCSQMIRNLKESNHKILVITIFTQYPEHNDNIFLNGSLRKKEDKEALEGLGVDLLYLDYPELMIRDELKDYTVFRQIVEPIRTLCHLKRSNVISDLIGQDLQDLIDKNDNIKQLYFPAAIGYHPDHILTFRACYNLKKKGLELLIYQDFPYCNNKWLKDIKMYFINYKNSLNIKVDPERKKEDILRYKSQFDIIFEDDDLDSILENYYEIYYLI